MGDILIKVPHLESILERPHKHLLVWGNDPDGGFVEPGEITPQPLRWTLSYIEQTDGKHFLDSGSELMHKFPY